MRKPSTMQNALSGGGSFENARYMKFRCDCGQTYKNDICINLSWSGYRNGEYEPYDKHSYPLDDSLTLRGIPKLDASGNLYYDGDTYESDGKVTRKYGYLDLDLVQWNGGTAGYGYVWYVSLPNAKTVPNSNIFNCFGFPYELIRYNGVASNVGTIALRDNGVLYVNNGSDTTKPTGEIIYELAEPTTETAEPYQNPQIVDDFGTEEYVTDSIIPVGHLTQYPKNLRDKVQHLPDLASADGDYIVRQNGSQMSLVPLEQVKELPDAPTTDGSYRLKVTVSNGTATYSWEAI